MATSVTLKPNAIDISGSTSGTTTLQASAVAGTTTLTLPAATDTLVGKATTDTLTNKTLTGAAMNGTLGATTPSTASVTTLTTSSTVTHSGGTANGVAYLDGSKVLTTGSALVFDGTNLGLGVTPSANSLAGSGYRNLEIGSVNGYGLFAGSYEIYLLGNAYYNSGWKYANSSKLASRYIQTDGIHAWFNAPSGTAGNTITFTQAMTLDAGGRLLLNRTTNNNNEALQVSGNANSLCSAFFANTTTGQSYGAYIAAGTNSTDYAFRIQNAAANTDYLKVTGDGNLLVGTTSQSASERFNATNSAANSQAIIANATSSSFNGDVVLVRAARNTTNSTFAAFSYYNDGAAAYKLRIWDSGNVVNTNNSYGAISDAKLKENIVDATPKLEKLNQVRVVNFNFIGDQQKQLGVVAQELEQIFPSMIDESPDKDAEGNDLGTTTKSVKYSVFVPMLIKAIQEQQALITQLQADVALLKGA